MKKSIGQRAVDFAGDRSQGAGHGFPSWEASLIEKGYEKGAKDQKKIFNKLLDKYIATYTGDDEMKSMNEYIIDSHVVEVLKKLKKS